jgi:hypothetical protein
MPQIKDMSTLTEKKIDLSAFWGEEAFITIKKMSKYEFTLLLNRSRNGYSSKMFLIMCDWKEQNVNEDGTPKELTNEEYLEMKNSISVEETEERILSESQNDRDYYSKSILPNKHNFTDKDGNLIEINGEEFYNNFSGLMNDKGQNLNDILINEIVTFNHTGITLGELTGSR